MLVGRVDFFDVKVHLHGSGVAIVIEYVESDGLRRLSGGVVVKLRVVGGDVGGVVDAHPFWDIVEDGRRSTLALIHNIIR